MTKPDIIHRTGGFLWTGDSDIPPANAIPIKDWTMTMKTEYREDGPEGWFRTLKPMSVTGSISGNFASAVVTGPSMWAAVPRSGPGRRKAERMRRRGY